MLYLLDANILIRANQDYYPINRVPEFWEWIIYKARNGLIKMPIEIIEEVKNWREDDPLCQWIGNRDHLNALLLQEEVNPLSIQQVVRQGYGVDPSDILVEKLKRDPFLIAYALNNPGRCVVTNEQPKPSRLPHNRKVSDACNTLAIQWCDVFGLITALDFSTSWRHIESE